MLVINKETCVGCGLCEGACFSDAIHVVDGVAQVNDNCILCGNCVGECPQEAITLEGRSEGPAEDLSSYSGVWVVMENDSSKNMPRKVSYELLSEGRRLADLLGERVTAIDLCGKLEESTLDDLQGVGCDELFLVENEALARYNTELFSGIVTELVRRYKPSIVLFPGTENGRDLAPRVSAKLQVGLTADCTGLDINENGELVQVRPTYGGNIIASIITPNHRPQMASVRGNVFSVVHRDGAARPKVTRPEISLDLGQTKVKCVGIQPKTTVYKDVEEAEILLVGGYGIGREGFDLLQELALKVGAAVGATRKAVDEGWAPFEIQIGQTGKMVAPELYIGFGVSGALQHSIGIRGAKKIIAVNNDPTALLFGQSDVAILGDAKSILKELIRQADEKKKEVFSILK